MKNDAKANSGPRTYYLKEGKEIARGEDEQQILEKKIRKISP